MHPTVTSGELSFIDHDFDIDQDAVSNIPDDVQVPKGADKLVPVKVNSDGNCLPSCGSVFAFATPDRSDEMRVRIIKELALNEDAYLDDTFLKKGLTSKNEKSLKSQFA
ncbi:hypothetical protein DPMN_042840 [Dreissena polymorpha]|uniref:Uncharacterized protein n=1 Tax=Dreissena polymorpha TaxID=45954 RepID=A0A9D4CZU8_DREPO|nr:hypothetical protein DPMN_042840 [Dreissena polymorpha]